MNEYIKNRTPGTSYPEQFFYCCIKQLYKDTVSRGRVLKNIYKPNGIEFDIVIPSEKVAIEYNSTYWHNTTNKLKTDELKAKICKECGVRLIVIEDDTYNEKEVTYTYNFIRDNFNGDSNKLTVALCYILKTLNKSINDVDISNAKRDAYKFSHGKIEYEKSLAHVLPELAIELNDNINKIKAEELLPYSNIKLYWTCRNCGYGKNGEWEAQLSQRAYHKTGCNRCGYNWSTHRTRAAGIGGELIKGVNDLMTVFPELICEWNTQLNIIKPDSIYTKSSKIIYWTCTQCSYGSNGEWKTALYNRTEHKSGCPMCRYNIFDGKFHKNTGNKMVYKGYTDLLSTQPNLAKEFNVKLNNCNPDEIISSSNKKVYWTCIKCGYGSNGEWLSSPNSRFFNKSSCPKCRYNIFDNSVHNYVGAHGRKSLLEEYPKLAEEWNYELNDIKPEDIGPGSHRIVYWKCPKCNYGIKGEWAVEVRKRIARTYACNCCGYKWQLG